MKILSKNEMTSAMRVERFQTKTKLSRLLVHEGCPWRAKERLQWCNSSEWNRSSASQINITKVNTRTTHCSSQSEC